MLVPVVQLEVLGLRARLDDTLAALQRLRAAEVVPPADGEGRPAQTDADLGDRLGRLLALVPPPAHGRNPPGPVPDTSGPAPDPRELLQRIEPQVDALVEQRHEVESEAEMLTRQVRLLGSLQPLVPELSKLDDRHLADLGLASVALLLEDPQGQIVSELARALHTLLGPAHLLVTSPPDAHGNVGCLLVLRRHRIAEVQERLGTERIAQVGVPTAYAGRSLRGTVAAMRTRLDELPQVHRRTEEALAALLEPEADALAAAARRVHAHAERAAAARAALHAERTFCLRIWVPVDRIDTVASALEETLDSAVDLRRVDSGRTGQPPVLLRNRRSWLAYQQLVGLLSWPTARTVDPTGLMALVLPFFFGVMVGDLAYGLAMMGLAFWLRRWSRGRSSAVLLRQAARVLALGGVWSTVFGALFGEFLGSVGHHLGMPALWFYRGGPEALVPLLLFSIAIGVVHVTLGLVLGMWTSARLHRRGQVVQKIGNLFVLAGLFALAGVAATALPSALLTPAVAVVVVGLVAACASQGALGLLLGPLGVIGVVGNVLSYLRLAAVGLASVYLAGVANTLAVSAPLLLGVVVAAFFHALNLALAGFSPTVQALRLHYVEFFGQFFEGEGRLFAPLGADGPLDVDLGSAPTRATR